MSFNSCKGFIGKWLIYETMPRYEPPRVKFRYGNESWQVISPANNYTITPIYDSTKYYSVTYAAYQYNGICDFSSINNIIQNTRYCKGDFRLEVASDEFYSNYGYGIRTYRLWQGEGFGYTYQVAIPNGSTYWIYQGCRNWDSNYLYNANSNTAPWLVSVVPIDHTINYRFTVYNNDQPVHEEIRDIQPEAEILPESCKYFNEDKRYVRDYYNYNKSSYMDLVVQGNKAWVNAYILDINREFSYPINLYYGESECDLPPKIDTECVPECLKCPSGTCAIPCGDVICCYNNDGISVLSIPKERYCNE
jgi:hypothetical protein